MLQSAHRAIDSAKELLLKNIDEIMSVYEIIYRLNNPDYIDKVIQNKEDVFAVKKYPHGQIYLFCKNELICPLKELSLENIQ